MVSRWYETISFDIGSILDRRSAVTELELLERHLTKKQLKQYKATKANGGIGKIVVKGASGRTYVVNERCGPRSDGQLSSRTLGFEGSKLASILCVGLPSVCSNALNLLALKFMLENDDNEVSNIANDIPREVKVFIEPLAKEYLDAMEIIDG